MRISPTLLLLLLLITVFSPSIQTWVISGGSAWYRPYIIWLLIIMFAARSVRRQQANDL